VWSEGAGSWEGLPLRDPPLLLLPVFLCLFLPLGLFHEVWKPLARLAAADVPSRDRERLRMAAGRVAVMSVGGSKEGIKDSGQ
jgi:hypothetical protein